MPDQIFEEEMKRLDYWLGELGSLEVNRTILIDASTLHDMVDDVNQTSHEESKNAYAGA